MDCYAVFGHPIGHSKSPRIHSLFAAQTRQDIDYSARDVPAEAFESELRRFLAEGGRGLNCTVPLKELAYRRCDKHSERAERAKAVNTLLIQADGQICGDNTDGIGLVRDLQANLGLDLAGRRILLLGAGGASRGILEPLLAERPERVFIANRTAEKARVLADEFRDLGPVRGGGFSEVDGDRFELILNATAASLGGDLPDLPEHSLAGGGACYDLAYGQTPTPFVVWGRRLGAAASVDGIGMLVEQAAEAFFLWRGLRPAARPVIELLNQERGWAV